MLLLWADVCGYHDTCKVRKKAIELTAKPKRSPLTLTFHLQFQWSKTDKYTASSLRMTMMNENLSYLLNDYKADSNNSANLNTCHREHAVYSADTFVSFITRQVLLNLEIFFKKIHNPLYLSRSLHAAQVPSPLCCVTHSKGHSHRNA